MGIGLEVTILCRVNEGLGADLAEERRRPRAKIASPFCFLRWGSASSGLSTLPRSCQNAQRPEYSMSLLLWRNARSTNMAARDHAPSSDVSIPRYAAAGKAFGHSALSIASGSIRRRKAWLKGRQVASSSRS
jgi:hypothetical protein